MQIVETIEELGHTPGSLDEHIRVLRSHGFQDITADLFERTVASAPYVVVAVDPSVDRKKADEILARRTEDGLEHIYEGAPGRAPDVIITSGVQRYTDNDTLYSRVEGDRTPVGWTNLAVSANLSADPNVHVIRNQMVEDDGTDVVHALKLAASLYRDGYLSKPVIVGGLTEGYGELEQFSGNLSRSPSNVLLALQGDAAASFISRYIKPN